MTHCLDAWAVIAWLETIEPAATRIEQLLAAERPLMSWINLGEVFYLVSRRHSRDDASDVVRTLRGKLTLELPDEQRVLLAAAIKSDHPLAYADAFAVATALGNDAVLLTGDPEILDAGAEWMLEDLR